MPNQTVLKSTATHYETVETNCRQIDSLAWLMIAAASNIGDDPETVSDTMQVISRLAKEAHQANKAILQAIKGGSNE